MTAEDIKALSVAEKVQIMEVIWEEFREKFNKAEISDDLKHLLDERRARVREGKAKLLDWDAVKHSIGRG